MSKPTDLDVDSPEKVPGILRNAAQDYWQSVEELSASWQDKEAGKIWGRIAGILEVAANRIEDLESGPKKRGRKRER